MKECKSLWDKLPQSVKDRIDEFITPTKEKKEYVEKKALIMWIRQNTMTPLFNLHSEKAKILAEIERLIWSAPVKDVVEVVRCKDCDKKIKEN